MFDDSEINNLYRYAHAISGNDDLAYDLVHDAILATSKKTPENAGAYAKTCIRNGFFDSRKYSNRETPREEAALEGDLDELGSSADLESIAIDRDEVTEILSSLSPEDRELLYLIGVEEFTFREAAEITGKKIGTLLSRFHRIKKVIQSRSTDK